MKTEQDYEKAIAVKDAEIETLRKETATLANGIVYETLKLLRTKGLNVSEVIDSANNAIEQFEDSEDALEAERIQVIEAAEDAEEAKHTSVTHKPSSEEGQAGDVLDKDRADYLGKIDNHWS